MWMTFSCLFMSVENSPFLPLSCFPSQSSSYRKAAFWCYLLVPAVNFFSLSISFFWFFLVTLSPGRFIHPSSCAELFPFLITHCSDAPHLILLTRPNAHASGNSALKTPFSVLIQCPGWLPRPSLLYGGSTCRKCDGSFGTAWAFSLRKYLKLWNACQRCTWNSANLKKITGCPLASLRLLCQGSPEKQHSMAVFSKSSLQDCPRSDATSSCHMPSLL